MCGVINSCERIAIEAYGGGVEPPRSVLRKPPIGVISIKGHLSSLSRFGAFIIFSSSRIYLSVSKAT
jgi:hypothetical protein